MEKIIQFLKFIKHWLYNVPTAKPPKLEPIRVKATEVAKEWMIITYHGQKIPMHENEYPLWKQLSRKDKRAMKDKTAKQEREGLIRFEEIEGKVVCIRNINYDARAEKAKQKR